MNVITILPRSKASIFIYMPVHFCLMNNTHSLLFNPNTVGGWWCWLYLVSLWSSNLKYKKYCIMHSTIEIYWTAESMVAKILDELILKNTLIILGFCMKGDICLCAGKQVYCSANTFLMATCFYNHLVPTSIMHPQSSYSPPSSLHLHFPLSWLSKVVWWSSDFFVSTHFSV